MTAPRTKMTREEVQRHIRWQVSLADWNLGVDLWHTLPAETSAMLEYCWERKLWPVRWSEWHTVEYRVYPVPMQIDLVSGNVRRMQRVVLLSN